MFTLQQRVCANASILYKPFMAVHVSLHQTHKVNKVAYASGQLSDDKLHFKIFLIFLITVVPYSESSSILMYSMGDDK